MFLIIGMFDISGQYQQYISLFLYCLYYSHLPKKAICHYVDVKVVRKFSRQFKIQNLSAYDKILMLLQTEKMFGLI